MISAQQITWQIRQVGDAQFDVYRNYVRVATTFTTWAAAAQFIWGCEQASTTVILSGGSLPLVVGQPVSTIPVAVSNDAKVILVNGDTIATSGLSASNDAEAAAAAEIVPAIAAAEPEPEPKHPGLIERFGDFLHEMF